MSSFRKIIERYGGFAANSLSRYKGTVNQKKKTLEEKGTIVTPVIAKRYCYNYKFRLQDVLDNFKMYLKEVLNQKYVDIIVKINGLSSAIDSQLLKEMILKNNFNEMEVHDVEMYGRRWNVKG